MAAPYIGEWVMVVEYLESSMSRDLLGKFPDNSAFDFDYSQSSIWSPLVPRGLICSSNDSSSDGKYAMNCGLSRKLVYEDDLGLTKVKKFSAKIKRKLADALLCNLHKYQKMKKRKKDGLSFSPVPSSNKLSSTSSTPTKGWEKVLKAASKHFKKKKKNRRRDSIGHFSGHLTDADLT